MAASRFSHTTPQVTRGGAITRSLNFRVSYKGYAPRSCQRLHVELKGMRLVIMRCSIYVSLRKDLEALRAQHHQPVGSR